MHNSIILYNVLEYSILFIQLLTVPEDAALADKWYITNTLHTMHSNNPTMNVHIKLNITGINSIEKTPNDDTAISIADWKNEWRNICAINKYIYTEPKSLPRVLSREARQFIDIIFRAEKKL